MPTIVCQNLISCFESQLTETTTTLKLKVAQPPSPPLPPVALDFCKKLGTDDHRNFDFGNWSFLHITPEKLGDKESSYTKSSSFSRLRSKSLELCTENLGSETGTDIISDDSSSIFSSSPPFSPSNYAESFEFPDWKQTPKHPHHKEASSCRKIKNFPPPLTTMSGSSSLQVRRHREGGRLIIEAVEAPFRNSYLQAERSDGRLKLCFFESSDTAETTICAADDEEEEKEEECGDETTGEEEIEEHRDEVELDKEEFDGEINMEMEMEMEKFQTLSRCSKGGSHGNKGLYSDWKPALLVATS